MKECKSYDTLDQTCRDCRINNMFDLNSCYRPKIEGVEQTHKEITEPLKLAMRAGAYAIRNNKKYQSGWFKSGDDEIQWLEAEKLLLCTAEGLNPDECEIKHE